MMLWNKTVLAVCLAPILGCSNSNHKGGATPPPVTAVDPPAESAPAQSDARKQSPQTIPSTGRSRTSPPLTERFSFADNIARAHLRSGGLLIDFGTPARHKYTMADWKSGFHGDITAGDQTFSYLSANTGYIFFFALEDEAGGGAIAIRAKAIGAQKGRVYLNDKFVGAVEVGADFDHSQIRFDEGIKVGRNEIRIHTNGKKQTPEGIPAALAVDYVRITPADHDSGPAAATYDTPLIKNASTNRSDILLTNGESLTYYLPIPKGAHLKATAWRRVETEASKIAVTVRSNSSRKPLSIEQKLSTVNTPLDLDMSTLAGEMAEVSFRALSGSVVLHQAVISEAGEAMTPAPGKRSAKNFILVLIDTLRSDKLDLYNRDTRVRTACLSALGRESMVFGRAFAPENWTKPSVASLLTGLYPTTHNTKSDRDKLPKTAVMMPEHFKSLGFTTAGFVANGYISNKFGFERGWDTWTNYVREGKPNRAQFVFGDAVTWLEQRTDDNPFFLYIHTIDPHVPYVPPRKYLQMYDGGNYTGPVKAAKTAQLAEQIKTGRIKLNDRDKMRFEALYDGEITYHDDQLAQLRTKLAELDLLEDTLIVITSDHGEEFFDHGSAGHGHSMYEELLHVPLLVRLPGDFKPANRAEFWDDDEASLVDVFPTACDILGIECPAEIEGRSLLLRLTAKERDTFPSVAASEFLANGRTARMGRYKLIYRGHRTTLFDLKRDPKETADLSDVQPVAFQAVSDSLGAHLGRFVDSGGAGATAAPKQKHQKEKAVIDPETARQLKALGYLGGE
jgi:choline-sulfatase